MSAQQDLERGLKSIFDQHGIAFERELHRKHLKWRFVVNNKRYTLVTPASASDCFAAKNAAGDLRRLIKQATSTGGSNG